MEYTSIPTYTGSGTSVTSYKSYYGTSASDPRSCGLAYNVIANVKSGDTINMNSASYATRKAILAIG